ncbi:hypothetical protein [Candidatus Nitrosocosmicus franklandus]|uniref:hypothetical protein n=1 Tax=Candidatus Nitrosocosmicus franklandianus TaxID=1798806 RepID=UPI001558C23A|nr:hypothetical protein [Candidatus Nitrosocosmicus franklandus]
MLGAPNSASNKRKAFVVKQKNHQIPLLDIPMAYLKTNTRLENLEVVDRGDDHRLV